MRGGLVAIALVSCGARTDLGASVSHGPSAGCTDALDPAAFTRTERQCSDGSRRAPAHSPVHPHIAWTLPLDDGFSYDGVVAVDATGTAFVGSSSTVRAFAPAGTPAWTANLAGFPRGMFISSQGPEVRVFDDVPSTSNLVSLSTSDGSAVSSSASLNAYAHVLANPDGTYFADVLDFSPFGSNFAGVARLGSDASVQWIERGNCQTGVSDLPAPHDFVRSGDDLVIACRVSTEGGVEVLAVNASDEKSFDTTVDGDLASEVVVMPDGHLAFYVTSDEKTASLVDIGRGGNGVSLGGPSIGGTAHLAIAANGVLVVDAEHELLAISNGAALWRIPNASAGSLFVDDEATIVVATMTSVRAVDLASGAIAWELAIPDVGSIASGGPGRVYVLQSAAITLIED